MDIDNGVDKPEADLVRLYMELTGASESVARGVYIHVFSNSNEATMKPLAQ